MADDHAVNAISAYGSTLINTKHIDRLASEGLYTLLHDEFALRTLTGGYLLGLQPCERGLHPDNEAQFNVPKFCEAPATGRILSGDYW